MPAKGCTIWNVRAMPARADPVRRRPRDIRCPRKGRARRSDATKPAMIANSVVLPAPLGPIRPGDLARAAHVERRARRQPCNPPKLLATTRTSTMARHRGANRLMQRHPGEPQAQLRDEDPSMMPSTGEGHITTRSARESTRYDARRRAPRDMAVMLGSRDAGRARPAPARTSVPSATDDADASSASTDLIHGPKAMPAIEEQEVLRVERPAGKRGDRRPDSVIAFSFTAKTCRRRARGPRPRSRGSPPAARRSGCA